MQEKINELLETGLLKVKKDAGIIGGASLYKYTPKVHFNNLWEKSPFLLKARGFVMRDSDGVILSHPFDKTFNYGEKGFIHTSPSESVTVVEKLNGFLACVSNHPDDMEKLLLNTTGTFDSDFVQYIRDLISKDQEEKFVEFFKRNGPRTLMFEAIHKDDNEHIIKYDEQGLWLIGARGHRYDDKVDSEERLDEIASEIGVNRPKYESMNFGDLVNNMKTCNIEGYMVRAKNGGDYLMKIKSSYYLVTKFLGRGDNKADLIFGNKQNILRKVDEEFLPLIDFLRENYTIQTYKELGNVARIEVVRSFLDSFLFKESNLKMKL